ncbi:hypothetical protein JX580_09325 [Thiomicrospira microaerophila]|uniref:hypothetical protein n=1 Tax=Thiomicrospira microaerophila TaxID=406020 RepID=UPI00200E0716|nr:hypothetical protein [Thiomicrospira microaerophila]UQB41859.1 hypothetical protein JX580_09325 [Thiomicrospira microaerophila]
MTNPKANQDAATPENDAPFWQFIHPEDYVVPELHIQKATANAWRVFKKNLRDEPAHETLFKPENELQALSEVRLSHFVPQIPWHEAAAALDAQIKDWFKNDNPHHKHDSVKFLVGQPFSGHANIVQILGQRHNAQIIAPLTPEQILNQDLTWFDQFTPDQLWVLPELERCFLRHTHGLSLVRRVLSLATQGHLGQGIIGCDSWAWAFFQRIHAWPATDVLTLQAFDAERLTSLISDYAHHSKMHIHYLSAINGNEILTNEIDSEQTDTEFNELVAHCRGNLALALHYWQERLYDDLDEAKSEGQLIPDDEADDPNDTKQNAVNNNEEPTTQLSAGTRLWLAKMPAEPSMPTGNPEAFFLVLHALLIHNGLDEIGLENVLPYSQTRCQGLLAQLEQAQLVEYQTTRWLVKKTAYPTIRRLLINQNYLSDAF